MADDKIKISLEVVTQQATKGIQKFKSGLIDLGKSLNPLSATGAVTFGTIAASAVLATKKFAKFDNELRGVKTLLNENSFGAKGLERGFKDLTNEVLDLAQQTPVAIDSLNKSLFDTISAGIDAGDSIKFLGSASKLAVAGLTDVSVATDGLTTAVNAFGFNASDAEKLSAKFFTAQKAGKTTIAELSSGLGTVAANANAAGISFDELLSSTAALTTAGIATSEAYTGLKALISNISKPTADAAKEAKRLGVEFDASALRSKGLSKFLEELTKSSGFTKDSIVKLFGSVEAQKVAFSLTGAQGEKFKETLKEISNESKNLKTFSDAYKTSATSAQNVFKTFNNSLDTFLINVGKSLAPLTQWFAELGTSVLQSANDLFKAEKGTLDLKKVVEELNDEMRTLQTLMRTGQGDPVDLNARLAALVKNKRAIEEAMAIEQAQMEARKELVEDEIAMDLEKTQRKSDAKSDADKAKEEAEKLHKEKIEAIEKTHNENIAKERFKTRNIDLIKKQQYELAKTKLENEGNFTRLDAERFVELEKTKNLQKEQRQRLIDERRYGKNVADAKAFFRSQELKDSRSLLDNLATLGAAGSKRLGKIAKVASYTRAIINIAEGVTAGLAKGGPLGFAMAAATAAAGAVQLQVISQQQFAKGGVVQGGMPMVDSVPIVAQSGELITPRSNFEEVIGSTRALREAENRLAGLGGGEQNINVEIGFTDDAFEIIEKKILERRELGIGLV